MRPFFPRSALLALALTLALLPAGLAGEPKFDPHRYFIDDAYINEKLERSLPLSDFEAGIRALYGIGVPPDAAEAERRFSLWLEGDAPKQSYLGGIQPAMAWYFGMGLKQDLAKARKAFVKGEDYDELAASYYNPPVGEPDLAEARKAMEKIANERDRGLIQELLDEGRVVLTPLALDAEEQAQWDWDVRIRFHLPCGLVADQSLHAGSSCSTEVLALREQEAELRLIGSSIAGFAPLAKGYASTLDDAADWFGRTGSSRMEMYYDGYEEAIHYFGQTMVDALLKGGVPDGRGAGWEKVDGPALECLIEAHHRLFEQRHPYDCLESNCYDRKKAEIHRKALTELRDRLSRLARARFQDSAQSAAYEKAIQDAATRFMAALMLKSFWNDDEEYKAATAEQLRKLCGPGPAAQLQIHMQEMPTVK